MAKIQSTTSRQIQHYAPGETLTIAEAAAYLHISRQRLDILIRRGRITTERCWGRVFVRLATLKAYRPGKNGRPPAKK